MWKAGSEYVGDLKKLVSNLGLKLAEDVSIKGRSGIKHFFKLVVKNSKIVTVINFSTHLTVREVCEGYVYKIDVGIPQIILYVDKEEDAEKIASQLNVGIFSVNELRRLKEYIIQHK